MTKFYCIFLVYFCVSFRFVLSYSNFVLESHIILCVQGNSFKTQYVVNQFLISKTIEILPSSL